MKSRFVLQLIINSIIVLLFLGAGISVFILNHTAEEYSYILLGTISIIVGVCKGVIYLLNGGIHNHKNVTFVTSAGMIFLGLFFFLGNKDIATLCFGWGLMELMIGLIEVYIDILETSEGKKTAPFEMMVNIGTIVFAILLCIKTGDGLKAHLIFLSISLVLNALIHASTIYKTIKERNNND